MKLIAALFLSQLASSENLVRVFYKPDKKVIVAVANRELCSARETEQACVQRVTEGFCPRDPQGACLPSSIVESATLPPRRSRAKWRGNKASGVYEDATVVTKAEKVAKAEADLDAELAKAAPDPVRVIALNRTLEKEKARPDID